MYLNTDIFLSAELKEQRRQNWAAFFSRVENSTTSNDIPISSLGTYNISGHLSDGTESEISLPEQYIYNKHIIKSSKLKFKKSRKRSRRKLKNISKQWRLLHRIVCNNDHLFEKYQINSTNSEVEIDVPNITSNSESISINSKEEINGNNYYSSDSVTNYNNKILFNTPNNLINGIKLKNIDSKSPRNTTNGGKEIIEKHKCKPVVVALEKLDFTKNICKSIRLRNINGDEELNNETSQIDRNYTDVPFKTQLLERKYRRHKYANKENDYNVKQEMMHSEIETTNSYTQETNKYSDKLEQTTKKRRTMTLHELINQPETRTKTTSKKPQQKRTYSFYSDGINNKQIEYNDIVIPLTLEELSNGTL